MHRIKGPEFPAYPRDVYQRAYLNPRNVRLLDRELVVKAILSGQHRHLRESAFSKLEPGQTILQPACVYGEFSPALARYLGPRGRPNVIDSLLGRVGPGGKAVFVDAHKPHWAHPLKAVTSLVFDTLEPFAKGLWRQEINEFASNPGPFEWRKETYFGGLFQKVVARRARGAERSPAPGIRREAREGG